MIYVAVGIVLLLWGIWVARADRKVGTVLAVTPVVLWFGCLTWFVWTGTLDTPAGDELLVYLVIGLLAFVTGSKLTGGSEGLRGDHKER